MGGIFGGGGKKGGGDGGAAGSNPAQTAAAQGAANKEAVRESALVNQINTITPFGRETYTGSIGSPDRTRTITLTPEAQEQLDYRNQIGAGLLGFGANTLTPQVAESLDTPLNFEGLTEISGADDLDAYGGELEQATFQRGLNLLRPEMDRQREMEHTRLAVQGLPESGEAYDEAIGRLDRSQQQQLENLALSSVAAGRAEQSRRAGLEQQIRQQQIGELLTKRGQAINELSALIQGAPAISTFEFQAPQQYAVQPAPYLGAEALAAGVQQRGYNRQSDLYGNLINAGGLIGAGLLCSRDWKEDLGPASSFLDGIRKLPIRAWRYAGSAPTDDRALHIGPCAEHFRQLFGLGDGKTIHVVDAIGVTLAAVQELARKVDAMEAAHAGA